MNTEPYKVSILVPIYGVEAYMERCAVSLFEQTYSNIEYIFVDDCSKDESIRILKAVIDNYPNRKPHVRIVRHEKNRGLAAARNTAVANCDTPFLIHVDGDDWVTPNIVEECVKNQILKNADIVTANYFIVKGDVNEESLDVEIDDSRLMMEKILRGDNISYRIWGRLIRTSLYKDNSISLVEGANFAEDLTVIVQLLFFANMHSNVILPLYYYECSNSSSYTNNFSYKHSYQSLLNNDSLRNFFCQHAPKYLELVDIQELMKITGHMCLCSKNRENKNYYNTELLKRLDSIDKQLWKFIPLKKRMSLYLRHFELVRLYVRLGGIVNQMLKK